jgi:hypothetical protein
MRSRPRSLAISKASRPDTTPSCVPFSSTRRTSRARTLSLTLRSLFIVESPQKSKVILHSIAKCLVLVNSHLRRYWLSSHVSNHCTRKAKMLGDCGYAGRSSSESATTTISMFLVSRITRLINDPRNISWKRLRADCPITRKVAPFFTM